jgi:hypothetical protein
VTADEVAHLVATLAYKPGWTFKVGGPGGRALCVFARTPDSLRPGIERTTQHMFELPAVIGGQREFARWVLWCLLQAEQHEACEFLQIDGQRPFWPNHQDEGSPYALVERWESSCPT